MRASTALALAALVLLGAGPARAWPVGVRLPAEQEWSLPDVEARSGRYRVVTFDGHVHTDDSHDARHPTRDVLELAERADLDAVVITDHGSVGAQRDFAAYPGAVVPLIGEEVGGSFGHAVIWNVPERRGVHDAARRSMEALAGLVHERGGVVVLAHPGWWIGGNVFDPLRWMEYDALRRGGIAEGVDALELWNQQFHVPSRQLVDAWDALLGRGLFVPLVGNSDFHILDADRIGEPRNALLCPLRGAELAQPIEVCLVEGVRRGRLYVTDGPSLVLTVAGRTLGDVVPAFAHTLLAVEVAAQAPRGGVLLVRVGTEIIDRITLAAGERTERRLAVRVPASDSYLRVEIERAEPTPGVPPFSLLSNPVRIDVLPVREDGWRGPDEGRVPAPFGFRVRDEATLRRGRRPRGERYADDVSTGSR
jgi:hypothetical protein